MLEFLRRIFNRDAYWKTKTDERLKIVLDVVLKYLETVDNEAPYIVEGRWGYLRLLPDPIAYPVSIVLPQLGIRRNPNGYLETVPVLIMVWPPFLGSWEICRHYCTRPTWEYLNKIASHFRTICEDRKLHLLEIQFGDPVDTATLHRRLREIQGEV